MAENASDPASTFDQELLLWLGHEPPDVRAADAGRIHDIAAEFALGFGRLAAIGPAVTEFGSARTPREHPYYRLMREVGAALGRAQFAVITGGGGGLMEPANRGAKEGGALGRLQHRAAARAAAQLSTSMSGCASGTSLSAR